MAYIGYFPLLSNKNRPISQSVHTTCDFLDSIYAAGTDEPLWVFQLVVYVLLRDGLHIVVLHHLLFQFLDSLLHLLLFVAEYLLRYLIVHPHIKEHFVTPLLFFQAFLYDGLSHRTSVCSTPVTLPLHP